MVFMGVQTNKNFEFFLKNNFEDIQEGEWVAIYEDSVISHGFTLNEVIEKAKKTVPISKVLLSKVKKTASYLRA